LILRIPLGEGAEAGAERSGGLVAEVALEGSGVGIGHGHVAGLHGHQLLMRGEVVVGGQHTGTDEFLLEDVDKGEKVLGVVLPMLYSR
jgi:hypothetical protein